MQQQAFSFLNRIRQQDPPPLLLPATAASLAANPHPCIPQANGSDLEIGQCLGSGIDKSAFLILDQKGEPRDDVILKIARHQNDCRDNNQCENELALWDWLESVNHPHRVLFAGVVSILTEVTCEDENGSVLTRVCYTCEKVKKAGGYNVGSDLTAMKHTLTTYFGMYDLHGNNIGTAADGRPVVLDFGLLNGLNRIREQWDAAAAELDDDATPDQILASIEPLYSPEGNYDEENDFENYCTTCHCDVSEEHCHCTECRNDRRGGLYCADCHTVTNNDSRLTNSDLCSTSILCQTCLGLRREERTSPTPDHNYSEVGWAMHESCFCCECHNARLTFALARGLTCHDACRDAWHYRPQCPCKWCERKRSENARLYAGMKVSVHRLESAPILEPIKIGS